MREQEVIEHERLTQDLDIIIKQAEEKRLQLQAILAQQKEKEPQASDVQIFQSKAVGEVSSKKLEIDDDIDRQSDNAVSIDDIDLQDQEASLFIQQTIIPLLLNNTIEVIVEKEKLVRKT
jgi:hypothetical protein